MTATTALTAQNTLKVDDIHHTPPAFVRKQIDACIDDIGVDVVKTGERISLSGELAIVNLFSVSAAIPNDEKECWLLLRPLRLWPMLSVGIM